VEDIILSMQPHRLQPTGEDWRWAGQRRRNQLSTVHTQCWDQDSKGKTKSKTETVQDQDQDQDSENTASRHVHVPQDEAVPRGFPSHDGSHDHHRVSFTCDKLTVKRVDSSQLKS